MRSYVLGCCCIRRIKGSSHGRYNLNNTALNVFIGFNCDSASYIVVVAVTIDDQKPVFVFVTLSKSPLVFMSAPMKRLMMIGIPANEAI